LLLQVAVLVEIIMVLAGVRVEFFIHLATL
jgi:hypothetical protein